MRHKLIQARENKRLKKHDVADYLGVTYRMYCHMEAGTRTGAAKYWDALEELFGISQRILREKNDIRESA